MFIYEEYINIITITKHSIEYLYFKKNDKYRYQYGYHQNTAIPIHKQYFIMSDKKQNSRNFLQLFLFLFFQIKFNHCSTVLQKMQYVCLLYIHTLTLYGH